MQAKLEYVQEKFDYYNALIFEGRLSPVTIRLSRARRFLGKIEYKIRRGFFGKINGYSDFVMKISSAVDLPQNELDDVIIHEMIHYYILSSGQRDSSAHGKLFRAMMADINSRFGRNITITHKGSLLKQVDGEPVVRPRIVCVSVMQGGELGVTVCASTRVNSIKRGLARHYNVNKSAWYVSSHPFFARFPRSVSPKIYKANQEDLLSALSSELTKQITL